MATNLTSNKLTLNDCSLTGMLSGTILVGAGTDSVADSGTKTFSSGTWRGFYCAYANGFVDRYTSTTGISFKVEDYVSTGAADYIGGGWRNLYPNQLRGVA